MRVQNWPRLLDDLIQDCQTKTYELGVHDCFTVATQWLYTATGKDRRGEFAYTTKDEAIALIMSHGGFESAFSWYFDTPMIGVNHASRGDIVGYADRMKHLGICIGARVAVLSEQGMSFVSLSRCFGAWRI